MVRPMYGLAGIMVFVLGCRLQEPKPDQHARAVSAESASKPARVEHTNAWQRMKECAEQTERLAKRFGWVVNRREHNITILGWENHYNPVFERCYVQVFYFNGKRDPTARLPAFFNSLFDAFEGREIAGCTSEFKESGMCSVKSTSASDCGTCRKFIDERMGETAPQ